MNNDSQAIESFLAWLLQEPDPTVSAPSGDIRSEETEPDESGAGVPPFNYLDRLDSEEIGLLPDSLQQSNHFSLEENLFFQFGDRPAVQERFHTLLKRRLRAEIERNPPRFPWETEIYRYEAETGDEVAPDFSLARLWTTQLQSLSLPIPMPEAVLASLFEQCQTVVQSSLREGALLVQAVESLFPGQAPALNHLAGLVLASPSRSGTLAAEPLPLTGGFPKHYEVATPTQQMALSLMAAREIIEALTLKVSPEQPKATSQWLTAAGALTLTAEYQPQRLRIEGKLPCQGTLRLRGQQAESTAQRLDAGALSVEVFDLEPNQTCALEVELAAPDRSPLLFAVRLSTES
jgi:hypothetical protein